MFSEGDNLEKDIIIGAIWLRARPKRSWVQDVEDWLKMTISDAAELTTRERGTWMKQVHWATYLLVADGTLNDLFQGSKWDGMCWYGILALLWLAWNHTATSFWPTAIPVCRRPLNSCKISVHWRSVTIWSADCQSLQLLHPDVFPRCKICQKCVCSRGSAPDPAAGAPQTSSWI